MVRYQIVVGNIFNEQSCATEIVLKISESVITTEGQIQLWDHHQRAPQTNISSTHSHWL